MTLPLGGLREHNEGPDPPAAVTLPSLKDGGVRFALGTIFTEAVDETPEGGLTAEQYVAGDVEGAYRRGRAQFEVYLTWAEKQLVSIDLPAALRVDPGVGEVRGGMGVSEVVPASIDSLASRLAGSGGLHLGILVENADPIRSPEDLEWWVRRGVCAIGLSWARPSRYAMGNATPPQEREGLKPAGRDMVKEMDRLGVLHDASHLSDRSLDDLFEATDRCVIASHSNCRALIARDGEGGNPQRHLTDRAIREIARRGGVIGLNLLSSFLLKGSPKDRRATLDDAVAHVERICELTGSDQHVGLGSDMDGGFGADRLPLGVEKPLDLRRLSDALLRKGWTSKHVEHFAWRNFARVLAATPA